MKLVMRRVPRALSRLSTKNLLIAGVAATTFGVSSGSFAQATDTPSVDTELEEIVVTGIRSSLQSALREKRSSDNLIEVIQSDDIGKLPDQNLAEVLENITGVQITRTAGVGSGIQIRGTGANRTEFNGVSTVGSGNGRSGINVTDVNPAIIAAVEVTKAPEAKTIEGAIGGTINLRTIRPLELTETLGAITIQGEDSTLSTESIQPRFSGAFGDNWETSIGRIGVVVTGSYTEQEAVSFRPRADRDVLVTDAIPGTEFLGIQFLVQEQENDNFETTNLATTFEWEPNDNLTFFFDGIINDQELTRDQYRLQASGVSTLAPFSPPNVLETVDFGNFGGNEIGEFQSAVSGFLEPDLSRQPDNPNLRFTGETVGSRDTETDLFRLGGKWEGERLTVSAELSTTSSETVTSNISLTTNFINPNAPLGFDPNTGNNVVAINPDGTPAFFTDDLGAAAAATLASLAGTGAVSGFLENDNATPFLFDVSNNQLAFGINFDSPFAPTPAQLLDPANLVFDAFEATFNSIDNEEDALRVDLEYAFGETGITSVQGGFRYNEVESQFSQIREQFGESDFADSPSALLFADLLVQGPDNFASGDGRELAIENFLILDTGIANSDPQRVIDTIQNAILAHDTVNPQIIDLAFSENGFFNVQEETTSLYAQANFNYGIFRGNIGARYIDTEVTSTAFGPADGNGVRSLQSTTGEYDFVLPRFNLVAQVSDSVLLRFAYSEDILRPSFTQLNTSFTLNTNENTTVALGNPGLEPEEVEAFDIGVEWYFAPSAVASIGYFRKDRTNLFSTTTEGAALIPNPNGVGFLRESDPSCPGGGFFNPQVIPNVLGDSTTTGLCVDVSSPANDPDEITQDGIEIAFQYDLSNFEDSLGWASGFGFIANATFQDFDGGSIENTPTGRGQQILGDISVEQGLLNFSETAYNFTVFYEKYGISARARYTWREAFRTQDFAGGASQGSTLGFPVVTQDRGQLNASIGYDVTENLNINIQGVNITEEEVVQTCVTESGPVCFVGIPDRRITFGASYRF